MDAALLRLGEPAGDFAGKRPEALPVGGDQEHLIEPGGEALLDVRSFLFRVGRHRHLARDPEIAARERHVDPSAGVEDRLLDHRPEPPLLRHLLDEVLKVAVLAAAPSEKRRRSGGLSCLGDARGASRGAPGGSANGRGSRAEVGAVRGVTIGTGWAR